MNRAFVFTLVSFIFLMNNFLYAKDDFTYKFKNDFYLQHNEVTGNSPSSSTLTEGLSYYNLFTLYTKGNLGDIKYKLNIGVKLTDDRKKDVKDVSLFNLSGKVNKDAHTLDLGDYMRSFSKYSMSSTLKGAAYTYDNKIDRVDLLYGIAYSRWDNFWSNEVDSTKREVFGARYSRKVTDNLSASFDVVKTDDNNDILTGVSLYETTLYTVNSTYRPIKGLKLYGEYSFSDNKTKDTINPDKKNGGAIFLQATGNKNPSRVRLEYERVSPDFKTVTGSATPDREKAKATWRYKITKTMSLNTGFLWFRDNIENTKTATTNTYRPNIGVIFKHLFDRRYATLDLNYKLNIIDTSVNKTTDNIYDLNYKDRFGIFHTNTNLNYNIYDTNNNIKSQKEIKFNTTINTRHSFDDLVLKPSFMFGTWSMNDELTINGDNEYYQASFGLGASIPSKKISSTFRIGKNRSTRDTGDDMDKVFASFDLYWKVGKIDQFKNVMVYYKTYINDYSYTTIANDYQELSMTLGFKMSF